MCGILGLVEKSSGSIENSIEISSLQNRGPDSSGHFIHKNVKFYHTRLAVIDKNEVSKQPIISPCGKYVLICNGEIYNYMELKKQYDYDYQTTSDSEVILACYVSEGINGFCHLKGMFSFAIYDLQEKKVIVCRDAVGKKPLFYFSGNDGFVFSSSVDAIKDNIHSSDFNVNKEAITSYLSDGYIRPDISFYSEISPLMPGEIIEVNSETFKESVQRIPIEESKYEEFIYTHENIMKETRQLISLSTERRLQNIDHPVLLFSGGIDSTVLAKEMAKIKKNNVTCISLKPIIPWTQDEPYGIYASRKLDLKYIPVKLGFRNLMKDLKKAISLLDQPLSLYSYYYLTCLTKRAREFGNVLYLGEGGDEVFCGYREASEWFSKEEKPARYSYSVGPNPKSSFSDWGARQTTKDLLRTFFR